MSRIAIACALLALSGACATEEPSPPAEPPEEPSGSPAAPPAAGPGPGPRLVVLGSGTPIPQPERSGPAAAVVAGGSAYLVDFGPGVVRRAAEAFGRGFAGLAPQRLSIAFATHLHSDHTAGLPDLLFTPAVVGRREPLRLFGPPGIRAMAEGLLSAYAIDLGARRASGGDMRGYGIEATEIPAPADLVEVFRDGNVVVRALAVSHGSVEAALGYRFDAGGRSFVVSGDTAPSQAIAGACAGCDVLLHEAYCERGRLAGPPSFQRYHSTHHTSAVELGRIAARAEPKRLVVYHVLDFGCSDAQMLAEISSGFEGNAVIARDLDVFP